MVPVGKTEAVNDTFLLVKLANCTSVIFTGVEPMFFFSSQCLAYGVC